MITIKSMEKALKQSHKAAMALISAEDRTWSSDQLEQATQEGKIRIVSLGETLIDIESGIQTEIKQLQTPITWTINDVWNDPLIYDKLTENGIQSQEFQIEQVLDCTSHILCISKTYRMDLGSVHKIQTGDPTDSYYALLYTALAPITTWELPDWYHNSYMLGDQI